MDTTTDENNNPFSEDENQENTENTVGENSEEPQTEKEDNSEDKYEELNNKYIRLAADFDNFRKRTAQEKEDLSKYANADLLKQLTAVLDTFDRAQEHLKDIEDCKTVKDSYEVAFKQLIETLKKIGLEEITAQGQPFNPNEHEAITQVPTDEFEPDTVAFVAQKGYKLNGKVLRPAMVGVAAKMENKENE